MENDNLQHQDIPHGSGAIYNLVRWLGNNQTTVYIFTVMIFMAGLGIYFNLPKEQFPDIKVPQI